MHQNPARTLVNLSPSGSTSAQATSAAHLAEDAPSGTGTRPVTFQQLPPTELEQIREQHHALGLRIGAALGMTTDWARTRWLAGPTRGTVVPQFFIRVPGEQPARATGEIITRRLARFGWGGRLIADDGEFRIDARRKDARIVLDARDRTISLTITGTVLAIGPTQKLHLLAGAYEDDLDS